MNNNLSDIQEIISSLETKDKNYAKISKALKILYFILVPSYVLLTILELNESYSFESLAKGVCFVLSMLIFAIIFTKYHKEYATVDYALPTLQMLKKAAYRYKPFRKETWWVITAILLIDIGLSLQSGIDSITIMQQVVFLLIVCFAFGVGLLVYWIKYKPLRDEIIKAIKEIEA